MKLKEIAEIKFMFPEKSGKTRAEKSKWIMSANLFVDNYIEEPSEIDTLIPKESWKLNKGDILLKRICPQFVNYIDIDEQYYIGYNLIVLKSKEGICAKYLACIVERNIDVLLMQNTGTVLPSISRNTIMDLDVGILLPYEEQVMIGELWWLQKEKNKLVKKLYELEAIKIKGYLTNYFVKFGGNKNGR